MEVIKIAKRPELSVVVPCYNEEKNLPLIVKRFREILPKGLNVEVVLVDNGSADNSNELLKGFAKKYRFIRLVHVKKNIGYGFGIWSGLKEARGEFLCWTHADMQTDAGDTVKAYNLIKEQKEPKGCFVKGKRGERPFVDTFFAFGMSVFESVILRALLYDINAQPNLFHRDFLKCIDDPPKDFSFDLYFYYMAKKKGYEIVRFPVEFPKRIHGDSHWNTTLKQKWRFIRRTLGYSVRLRERLK